MKKAGKPRQDPSNIDQTKTDSSASCQNSRDDGRTESEAAIQPAKKEDSAQTPSSGITSKQVVAIAGILLLVLLYVIALIAAVADTSSSGRLFLLCLFATIAIPILIWIYTWMYGKLRGRHTFADFRTKEQEEQLAARTRALEERLAAQVQEQRQTEQQADSSDSDKTSAP